MIFVKNYYEFYCQNFTKIQKQNSEILKCRINKIKKCFKIKFRQSVKTSHLLFRTINQKIKMKNYFYRYRDDPFCWSSERLVSIALIIIKLNREREEKEILCNYFAPTAFFVKVQSIKKKKKREKNSINQHRKNEVNDTKKLMCNKELRKQYQLCSFQFCNFFAMWLNFFYLFCHPSFSSKLSDCSLYSFFHFSSNSKYTFM